MYFYLWFVLTLTERDSCWEAYWGNY